MDREQTIHIRIQIRILIRIRIATLVRRAMVEVCTVPVLLVINIIIIIRPHRSTTYVDAAYCYRPSNVVCLTVCQSVGLSH